MNADRGRRCNATVSFKQVWKPTTVLRIASALTPALRYQAETQHEGSRFYPIWWTDVPRTANFSLGGEAVGRKG